MFAMNEFYSCEKLNSHRQHCLQWEFSKIQQYLEECHVEYSRITVTEVSPRVRVIKCKVYESMIKSRECRES